MPCFTLHFDHYTSIFQNLVFYRIKGISLFSLKFFFNVIRPKFKGLFDLQLHTFNRLLWNLSLMMHQYLTYCLPPLFGRNHLYQVLYSHILCKYCCILGKTICILGKYSCMWAKYIIILGNKLILGVNIVVLIDFCLFVNIIIFSRPGEAVAVLQTHSLIRTLTHPL